VPADKENESHLYVTTLVQVAILVTHCCGEILRARTIVYMQPPPLVEGGIMHGINSVRLFHPGLTLKCNASDNLHSIHMQVVGDSC